MMDLTFKVQTKIHKPVKDVFDAVYNPKKISAYFISGGSDGPLDEGKTVTWKFNDVGGKVISAPVKVIKMVPNQLIKFTWAASEGEYNPKTGDVPHAANYDNTVEMTFEALNDNETLIKITEGQWRDTPDGLQSSYQNCEGWKDMSCCLKAYLEYGINLRN